MVITKKKVNGDVKFTATYPDGRALTITKYKPGTGGGWKNGDVGLTSNMPPPGRADELGLEAVEFFLMALVGEGVDISKPGFGAALGTNFGAAFGTPFA